MSILISSSMLICIGCISPDKEQEDDISTANIKKEYKPKAVSVVIDLKTKLMWQKGEPGKMKWETAINYCQNLSLNGYSDWRLPNLKNLKRAYQIIPKFPKVDSSQYWSSNFYENEIDRAWGMDFYYGVPSSNSRNASDYVRCVRGG